MPEFPGGVDSLFAFINSNINYPKYERNHNIQGNVYVRFEVDKAGQISNPQIFQEDLCVVSLATPGPRDRCGPEGGGQGHQTQILLEYLRIWNFL